jgi:NitT/TauT family transport system substrate-binding protein
MCRLLVALAAGMLALGMPPARAQAPNTGKGQEPETVQITLGAMNLVVIAAEIGKAKGFFREEGINLDIQYLAGGAQAAQALIAGTVDYSLWSFDQTITSRVQGADIRAIASATHLPGQTLLIAAKYKDEIRSPKDLHGKLLGVTALGSGTQQTLSYILNQAGLDPKKESFIAVGGSTLPAAIENARVHAAMAADPYTTILLHAGKASALIDMRTLKGTQDVYGGPYLTGVVLTRPDVIEKKADLTQRLVNAFVKTNRWMASSTPQEIAAVLPAQMARDSKDIYVEALKVAKEMYTPDAIIRPEAVATVVKAHTLFGTIKPGTTLAPESLYDNRFVNRANARK